MARVARDDGLACRGPLRRAGLPAIRFHDLRHTFATLQLAAGTNPKIVSEVLAHKEVAITLDPYSHALPTIQTRAMARLDAILGRGDDAAPQTGGEKGSTKGSPADEANEKPDPNEEAGTIRAPMRAPPAPVPAGCRRASYDCIGVISHAA